MAIRAVCPNCQTRYQVDDRLAGKSVRCKACSKVFPVSGGEAPIGQMPPVDQAVQARPRAAAAARSEEGGDIPVVRPARAAVAKKGVGPLPFVLAGIFLLGLLLLGGAAVAGYVFWWSVAPSPQPAPVVAVVEEKQPIAPPAAQDGRDKDKPKEPVALALAPKGDFNIAEARKSVVLVKCLISGLLASSGTGFLISADGLVYTNRHVIVPTAPVKNHTLLVGVPSSDNVEVLEYYRAELVHVPTAGDAIDFALLKIAAKSGPNAFKPLPISYDKLELGAPVAAIGFPASLDAQTGVLSFNKGHVSAAEVKLDNRPFYQTDAAVNPGNSGGPLVNLRGEAVGLITYRKAGANNMGYALYLSEVRTAIGALSKDKLAAIRPQPGPVDSYSLAKSTGKNPTRASWDVAQGVLTERKDISTIDNNGSVYWITSKELLPEHFQLTMLCRVEFMQPSPPGPMPKGFPRTLCIRFGTAGVQQSVMERDGYRLHVSHEVMLISKNAPNLQLKYDGIPTGDFLLGLSRQGSRITASIDGNVVLDCTDPSPIPGRFKLSIGGCFSRLHMGDVAISALPGAPIVVAEAPKEKPKEKKALPKTTPLPKPKVEPPAVVKTATVPKGAAEVFTLSSPVSDLCVAADGKYLVLHLPKERKLTIFDPAQSRVVKEILVAEDQIRFGAGKDKLVVALPQAKLLQRYSLTTFERETSVPMPAINLRQLALGSSSDGPILLTGEPQGEKLPLGRGLLVDLQSLQPLALAIFPPAEAMPSVHHVRAAANGQLFTMWDDGNRGRGGLLLRGDSVRYTGMGAGVGQHLSPSADGQKMLAHVHHQDGRQWPFGTIYDVNGKVVAGGQNGIAQRAYFPATDGPYYFAYEHVHGYKVARLHFHILGDERPFAVLNEIECNRQSGWAEGQVPLDRRMQLMPSAKRIVYMPAASDKLFLIAFDPEQVLQQSPLDYLVVTSVPPVTVGRGEAVRYQIETKSRKPAATYKVEAGPPGLTVSAAGEVSWTVPADFAQGEANVVVGITTKEGPETFHSFRMQVNGLGSN